MNRCICWCARSSLVSVCTLALSALVVTPVVPRAALAAPVFAPVSANTVAAAGVQQVRERQPKRTTTKKTPARSKRTTSAPKRRAPVIPVLRHTTPRGAEALTADLGVLLGSRTRNGDWGAMVVSITRGDTLFAHGAGSRLVPASTMKLFTAAIALEKLGAEHTFSTDVLRDGALAPDGTLTGNLVLRGDGDPSLSPRFVRGGPGASMALLAQFVAGAGIRRVTGDVVADASGFESRRIPEGWLTRYAGAGYAAPFSALTLNENIVIVGVTPGKAGGAGQVFLEPATAGLTITNTVRTVAGGGTRISARRIGDDRVVVSGTIGARAGTSRYQLVVGDPVTFTAGAFKTALEAHGVKVDGTLRVGRTPDNAAMVTSLPSPPLARLVSVMNRESINIFAELLFRNAARGLEKTNIGSAEMASQTLQQFLTRQVGASPDAVSVTDGSGLSVLDRVTPRALVQLLDHAHQASWGSAFHASLPVAGESELLRNRMRATPAQGNLHAKTGTTNDVIGLSGYVTAENGEILAFAFLYNGKDRWHARETIDAMGPTMAAFSRD
ncbi:D-alanyl-D-alanine carboxypeptidase/D-alanyl-D-alanine endopeptidase [Gemmatimonas phototrophica]|uniref:D-alanyl-D-alanine carboxypeptidase/D-alanyl-D-alanine endopeptidase n=1 Tax=Gemmatimonas phototrophica TaxID=1379270 RepID=UPI0009EDD662|nr:D-alanyl-D-alanine carboxypeptidase/D-alanyl-D-alanine-endopeptidase [Gemmatimonas phototrophica]